MGTVINQSPLYQESFNGLKNFAKDTATTVGQATSYVGYGSAVVVSTFALTGGVLAFHASVFGWENLHVLPLVTQGQLSPVDFLGVLIFPSTCVPLLILANKLEDHLADELKGFNKVEKIRADDSVNSNMLKGINDDVPYSRIREAGFLCEINGEPKSSKQFFLDVAKRTKTHSVGGGLSIEQILNDTCFLRGKYHGSPDIEPSLPLAIDGSKPKPLGATLKLTTDILKASPVKLKTTEIWLDANGLPLDGIKMEIKNPKN